VDTNVDAGGVGAPLLLRRVSEELELGALVVVIVVDDGTVLWIGRGEYYLA